MKLEDLTDDQRLCLLVRHDGFRRILPIIGHWNVWVFVEGHPHGIVSIDRDTLDDAVTAALEALKGGRP